MPQPIEYDFCDSKQELDYIMNTVNNINYNTNEYAKSLKQINERLEILEKKINEQLTPKLQDKLNRRDMIFFAIIATFIITVF